MGPVLYFDDGENVGVDEGIGDEWCDAGRVGEGGRALAGVGTVALGTLSG